MRHSWKLLALVITLVCLVAGVVGAQETPAEMDPLLELLVEQGVITEEQARAVQVEYDRRRAAETEDAAVVPAPLPTPVPTPPVVEAKKEEPKWYDRIDLRGDLRMRYEGFHQEGAYDENVDKKGIPSFLKALTPRCAACAHKKVLHAYGRILRETGATSSAVPSTATCYRTSA